MRISTRSRYGIRLMVNLAANYNRKGYTLLKDVAKSENVSEKYLSLIVIPLRQAGLLLASRGMHGGYMLARHPSKITAGEIVGILEGDLDLIDCIKDEAICVRTKNCAGYDLWSGLSKKIAEFLESISLEDMIKVQKEKILKSIEYSI